MSDATHAFHPELRLARFLPSPSFGPRTSALARRFQQRRRLPVVDGVTAEDVDIPATARTPAVSVRLYRPAATPNAPMPALLWTHGGGFILGHPEQDEAHNLALVKELGICVAAVRYRLAPAHPSPAAVEDAYAALAWLFANAARLHVDPARVALGGVSAGAGLAACLALLARDRGELRPAFQLLVYPMLDDRTVTRTDLDTRHVRVWTAQSNAWAWSVYLGHAPGAVHTSPYAAAARATDLSGLPPAWLGVGTLDLFHDEDVAYAQRLRASGVPCGLHVVPGVFHGFDIAFQHTAVARAFWAEQVRALRVALRV